MVFTGVKGAPADQCGQDMKSGNAFTTVSETPTISEKPYITVDAAGKYWLEIPPLKTDSNGANFNSTGTKSVSFEDVYVASTTDTASAINLKLSEGLHVVLPPAIYHFDEPLQLNTTGQVLLGLGLVTLVSAKQNAVISVGDVDGVRVAGVLLQAGPPQGDVTAPTLLQWGTGAHAGTASAPGFLHDVFARVGGPDGTADSPVAVQSMLQVRSGHVIGDNLWLWRADHASGGTPTLDSNRCDNALIVDGADVTMYGLACEHAEKDLTLWNGERGRTYYYQSELPYRATQAEYGDLGYTGYRVAPRVSEHGGWGVGVYCFFADHNVTVQSGIVAPSAQTSQVTFVHPMTVFLNGNGGIQHVINEEGGKSVGPLTSWHYVCE